MAEKEYIEREKAYTLAKKICDAVNSGTRTLFLGRDILDWIDDLPAADVRPVVRGTWGNMWICSDMCGYEYACSCSVCGNPTYRMSLMERMPNFCPNCGADMREES